MAQVEPGGADRWAPGAEKGLSARTRLQEPRRQGRRSCAARERAGGLDRSQRKKTLNQNKTHRFPTSFSKDIVGGARRERLSRIPRGRLHPPTPRPGSPAPCPARPPGWARSRGQGAASASSHPGFQTTRLCSSVVNKSVAAASTLLCFLAIKTLRRRENHRNTRELPENNRDPKKKKKKVSV